MARTLANLAAAATLVFCALRYLKLRRPASSKPQQSAAPGVTEPASPQESDATSGWWLLAWIVPTVSLLATVVGSGTSASPGWWLVSGGAGLMLLIAYLVVLLSHPPGSLQLSVEAPLEALREEASVTSDDVPPANAEGHR